MVFAHLCEARLPFAFPKTERSLPGFGLGEIAGVSDHFLANDNHLIWQKLLVNCMCTSFRKQPCPYFLSVSSGRNLAG